MRSLSALLLLFVAAGSTASAQSIQTDGQAPLHAGLWAARFEMAGGGFNGIGALAFTSDHAAWALTLNVDGYGYKYGEDVTQERETAGLSLGRRWYGRPHGRIRAIGGLGVFGNYSRYKVDTLGNAMTRQSYGGGLYGELGGAVFVIPELSLGATWRGQGGAFYDDGNDVTGYTFSVGQVRLEGAFYF